MNSYDESPTTERPFQTAQNPCTDDSGSVWFAPDALDAMEAMTNEPSTSGNHGALDLEARLKSSIQVRCNDRLLRKSDRLGLGANLPLVFRARHHVDHLCRDVHVR